MAILKRLDKRTGITYVYESSSYWDKKNSNLAAREHLSVKLIPKREKRFQPTEDADIFPQRVKNKLGSRRNKN